MKKKFGLQTTLKAPLWNERFKWSHLKQSRIEPSVILDEQQRSLLHIFNRPERDYLFLSLSFFTTRGRKRNEKKIFEHEIILKMVRYPLVGEAASDDDTPEDIFSLVSAKERRESYTLSPVLISSLKF